MPAKPVLLFYYNDHFIHIQCFDRSIGPGRTATNDTNVDFECVLWRNVRISLIEGHSYPAHKDEGGDAKSVSEKITHSTSRSGISRYAGRKVKRRVVTVWFTYMDILCALRDVVVGQDLTKSIVRS